MKMDLQEIYHEDVNWIEVVQDRIHLQTSVVMVMKFWCLLIVWIIVTRSRKTLYLVVFGIVYGCEMIYVSLITKLCDVKQQSQLKS